MFALKRKKQYVIVHVTDIASFGNYLKITDTCPDRYLPLMGIDNTAKELFVRLTPGSFEQ